VLLKNAESDLVIWKPQPPLPATAGRDRFWWEQVDWAIEGAACGMHLDDEPEEIFPLPVFAMAAQHAEDTPGAVEFLRRYSLFWGMENIVVVDRQFRAVAIEKTARGLFDLYPADRNGRAYISGMSCRDPKSPQGRHTIEKRDEYCRMYGLGPDSLDRAFWNFCGEMESKLATAIATLPARCAAQSVLDLFATPYPNGLCLDAHKVRESQTMTSNTVTTYATFPNQRRFVRWQRSQDGKVWPKQPEVCQFS
jgi:hypothetical protein